MSCQCVGQTAVQVIGLCDPSTITFETPTDFNWTELSIPEVLTLPDAKPDLESIDQVFIQVKIISKRVIATPSGATNLENLRLTGFKLIVEGVLHQKVVYTAAVPTQAVHSAHFDVPFSTYIVLPPELPGPIPILDQNFCIDICVEDVFAMVFNCREIFKNVTLFLRARPEPAPTCP